MYYDSLYKAPQQEDHIEEKVVLETIRKIRRGIAKKVKATTEDKDLTYTEATFKARVDRTCMASILTCDPKRVSIDRMLMVAIRLGLNPKIKFE